MIFPNKDYPKVFRIKEYKRINIAGNFIAFNKYNEVISWWMFYTTDHSEKNENKINLGIIYEPMIDNL